jgi:hypothetical protein
LLHHFGEEGVETIKGNIDSTSAGQGMVAMTQRITATSLQPSDRLVISGLGPG